jgi:hypothetical protein
MSCVSLSAPAAKQTNVSKRIVVLTSGACGPAMDRALGGPQTGGAVWELLRTARMGSKVRLLCIDTDAISTGVGLASQLVYELQQDRVDEVSYRKDVRHSRKLHQSAQHTIGPLRVDSSSELIQWSRANLWARRPRHRDGRGAGGGRGAVDWKRCDMSDEAQVLALLDRIRGTYGLCARSCTQQGCCPTPC